MLSIIGKPISQDQVEGILNIVSKWCSNGEEFNSDIQIVCKGDELILWVDNEPVAYEDVL